MGSSDWAWVRVSQGPTALRAKVCKMLWLLKLCIHVAAIKINISLKSKGMTLA